MKFSLILATIERTQELAFFFDSMVQQSYKNFEIIIVDQNQDNRLNTILNQYSLLMSLKHIKIPPNGLSNARNIGMKNISGDIISFPDDDCWYFPNTLDKVVGILRKDSSIWGVSTKCVDENGNTSVARFLPNSTIVSKNNVFNTIISISFFIRIDKNIAFDENLGVGAKSILGAGEETDYILKHINQNRQILYKPEIKVGHPNPLFKIDNTFIIKSYKYGLSFGYILKKHSFPLHIVLKFIIRPFFALILYSFMFKFNRSKLYWVILKSRIKGYFYKNDK